MPNRYDVVVVGGRCAGSPLATMLARRGLNVCVVDRAHFPSETPSTHITQPSAVKILDDLGVLEPLWAAGATPIERFSLINDGTTLAIDDCSRHFGSPALCARRVTLDALLIEAAREAGATVLTGTKVGGLVYDGTRVAGVRTEAGEIRAPLVVGADGRHSVVAEQVNAGEYRIAPAGRMFVWGYFDGVTDHDQRLWLVRTGDLAFLASPTDSDKYMAVVSVPLTDAEDFLADRDASYARSLHAWPPLARLVATGRRDGPLRVVSKWHGYFREACGPGWVLLGDAGHFKDPTPGQGIGDSLRHGVRLAAAIEAGLGSGSLDAKLEEWWRWRDEDAREMHWFATDLGAPGASPAVVGEVLRDISASEADTVNLFRVFNHEVRPSQVLTTGRVLRAAGRVVRRRPRQLPTVVREIRAGVRDQRHRASRAVDRPPTRLDP
jgi:2-polyprenyl-6-methoxyphenol hydroxylase-like FAD-dependent oxidoreductase